MQFRTVAAILFAPLSVFGATLTFAEPPEPGGGGPPTAVLSSLTFTLFLPSGSSPPCLVNGDQFDLCQFQNSSGFDWTSVMVEISPSQSALCDLVNIGFTACSGGSAQATFSGGAGIPNGSLFGLRFSGWEANSTFVFTASPPGGPSAPVPQIPEPSSVALVALGLLSLTVRARHRW